ncbi:unnamed protein product, partial [Brassica rapa subsp. trilocularis]
IIFGNARQVFDEMSEIKIGFLERVLKPGCYYQTLMESVQFPRRMDTYTSIVVILCIALFAINLIFACFTCFSILHSFMTETTNQDFSDLRKNLIEPEEAKPNDEKVIIIAVSSNQGFSGSMDGDDCGQDCSHDICAC